MYPKSIQNLIKHFSKLPSIGPKTAERLVFHLLYRPGYDLSAFGQALGELTNNIKTCQTCFNFAENNPCPICDNPQRDKSLICIIAKPQDLMAIEKSKHYQGVYHILGGTINALENISPEDLKIKELVHRLKTQPIQEIILAFNPDMPGETTMLYLKKIISQFPNIKITRPARGLPMGADLEYADEITLENALSNRQSLN